MRLGLRSVCFAIGAALLLAAAIPLPAINEPEILPLSQVHPGMKGIAYTIFSGDQVEPMDLEVLGVLPNALGPKQDIILVELKGPKVEHTGVVAGMSGSPVYIDGKLVGALSLKLGIFTKEAIGGVTPIENILEIQKDQPAAPARTEAALAPTWGSVAEAASAGGPPQVAVPVELAQRVGLGSGNFLVPIETPLVFSGFYPQALERFSSAFAAYGMTAMQGGTAAPQPEDARLKPGDMVGMVLAQGDVSLYAGCTVTAIESDRVFACGHPLFNFGSVELPLTRGHVLVTLASSLASTKIMTTGGVIGTLTQDRTTAVMGRLGQSPRMVPLEMAVVSPAGEKRFHFELIENEKLTPLLVGLATFNGLVDNTLYGEGATLQLSGTIEIQGHSSVQLENMFSPTDFGIPDGFFVSSAVQIAFTRIYTNPYEQPHVEKISLRVSSLPDRRWSAIDGAWSEKSEVHPGETIHIKVMLRPYRGAPYLQEVPLTVPPQAARGTLRVLVSDSETLNRMSRFFSSGPQAQLPGLDALINLLNHERRNDRLYVTLLQPTPTLLVDDKVLPNIPASEINVLDQRRNPGASLLLWESSAGEWSVGMNQVIAGQHYLTITVK